MERSSSASLVEVKEIVMKTRTRADQKTEKENGKGEEKSSPSSWKRMERTVRTRIW